jgi:predicted ferric reductase
MPLKRAGAFFLLGIAVLAVIIAVLFLPSTAEANPMRSAVRFFALYGYLFLSVTVLVTPFLREVTQAFGKPFLKVHHSFAVLGLTFITLHPVFNALEISLLVFIPNFASWAAFWALAGRPALILIYVAVFAVSLRAKVPRYWRAFHALMYVALIFGFVHANIIGNEFRQNLGITLIYGALFVASIVGFAFKRYRNYKLRKRMSP